MNSIQCEPEEFEGRIIFMSMLMKLSGDKTTQNVFSILLKSRSMLADSFVVTGHV